MFTRNILPQSKTVIRCHEALDELAKHNTVHIKWIATHVGHWGNERADELAKIGTNTTKCPACDYETEAVTHFIGQCPAYLQIRADYFHTYHSNTDDIFNKQSLTRIVGYAQKPKRFLTPDEKDQSGVTYNIRY